MPSDIVTVYAVFGDGEEAERVAETLVNEELAACANLLAPCRSIYRWQGMVERAEEIPVLFKTTAEAASRLLARLAELHSYHVPAAVVWPIAQALAPYAEWVRNSVPLDKGPRCPQAPTDGSGGGFGQPAAEDGLGGTGAGGVR